MIKEIIKNSIVLARLVPDDAWQDGLNFYSNDEDYIQVGAWGYDSGKELLAHIHNSVERKVLWTQEVLYIRSGSIKAKIYDTDENFVEEVVASKGDTLILLRGGHGYTILEDGTQVLEIKNGPYVGADQDRRRF